MATKDDDKRIASEMNELRSELGCATRIETADYVVLRPLVNVHSEPKVGVVVGTRKKGDVVNTSLRRQFGEGSAADVWVQLNEYTSASESGEGWIQVDGTVFGLGKQLERRAFERPRQLRWYLAAAQVEIRDRIHRGQIVGHREAGRLLRTDLEMSGWARLTEDFRLPSGDMGESHICEGWFSMAANDVSRWYPPGTAKGTPPESLPATSRWFWVAAPNGCSVRDRPWGGLLTKREHGELLRGDLVEDGWLRLEEDFVRCGADSEGVRGKGGAHPEAVGEDEAGRAVWAEEVANSVGGELQRGWALIDGRDLGLPFQLQARALARAHSYS